LGKTNKSIRSYWYLSPVKCSQKVSPSTGHLCIACLLHIPDHSCCSQTNSQSPTAKCTSFPNKQVNTCSVPVISYFPMDLLELGSAEGNRDLR
jgi:hypothetical protein